MNKWIRIAIGSALLASAQCLAARKAYEEQQIKAREHAIAQRKLKERQHAERIVRNAKLQTARKKFNRAQDAQAAAERQQHNETQQAYQQEVQHFTQLTQDLALPVYTETPIADIIQETQCSLQKLTAYNPKATNYFQTQFERALRYGKHPMTTDGKTLYPNTQLLAQQSVHSLVDYTQQAQQLVEETATHAQDIAASMARTLEEHRTTLAALKEQLDAAENRIHAFDAHLAHLNGTLKKGELQAAQKETEAINLAQYIDTFNTVSSKLSQDRITHTEQLIGELEEKAHLAEQHTTLLILRLQEAEKAVRAVEKAIQTKK